MAGINDRIKDFLVLLNQKESDENVIELLEKLSGKYDEEYFNKLYDGLHELPTFLSRTMVETARGAYGVIYTCSRRSDICYKKIVSHFTYGRHNIYKEIFIQDFLSGDKYGKNYIPTILNIYKAHYHDPYTKVREPRTQVIIIEMTRLDKSLKSEFNELINYGNELEFSIFYKYTKILFQMLKYFNQKYGFAHRDLNLNNIMLKSVTSSGSASGGSASGGSANGESTESNYKVMLIDFGLSCITIKVKGETYSIKTIEPYRDTAPCRIEQDISPYLMSIDVQYAQRDKLSEPIIEFINSIFTDEYDDYIRERVQLCEYKRNRFYASQNFLGNLLTNPKYPGIAASLSVDRFLSELDKKATELRIPIVDSGLPIGANHSGGRRKKRKTYRKRR